MVNYRIEEFWDEYEKLESREDRMDKAKLKAAAVINTFFTKGLTKIRRVEEIRKILVITFDDLLEYKNEQIEDLRKEIEELKCLKK